MSDTNALLAQAEALQDAGDYFSLRTIAHEIVASAERDRDEVARGRGFTFLGIAEMRLNLPDEAERSLRSALDLFEGSGYARGAAGALMSLGTLELECRLDPVAARRWYERALRAAESLNSPVHYGIALANAAEVCRAEGDIRAGSAYIRKAIDIFEAQDVLWRAALARVTLAHLQLLDGEGDGASATLRVAEPHIIRSDHPGSIALYFETRGLIAASMNANEDATVLFAFAETYRERFGISEDRSLAPWVEAAKIASESSIDAYRFAALKERARNSSPEDLTGASCPWA